MFLKCLWVFFFTKFEVSVQFWITFTEHLGMDQKLSTLPCLHPTVYFRKRYTFPIKSSPPPAQDQWLTLMWTWYKCKFERITLTCQSEPVRVYPTHMSPHVSTPINVSWNMPPLVRKATAVTLPCGFGSLVWAPRRAEKQKKKKKTRLSREGESLQSWRYCIQFQQVAT